MLPHGPLKFHHFYPHPYTPAPLPPDTLARENPPRESAASEWYANDLCSALNAGSGPTCRVVIGSAFTTGEGAATEAHHPEPLKRPDHNQGECHYCWATHLLP